MIHKISPRPSFPKRGTRKKSFAKERNKRRAYTFHFVMPACPASFLKKDSRQAGMTMYGSYL
ncbi:MAG: hypothetical protein A2Y66_09125 [Nitrospirae bacterium RBG_13_41_22]|nr:MAG: hypothetical protein A2Y66_09125 [Nitrospirae bacterium RBG_13_41_22]